MHANKKATIAGKVWETLAAVRRSRGTCCNDIGKATALIVQLDNITPSSANVAALVTDLDLESNDSATTCEIDGSVSRVDLQIDEKDIFKQLKLLTTGSSDFNDSINLWRVENMLKNFRSLRIDGDMNNLR